MTIGEHIRAVRMSKGLTQKQLSEKLGISYVNISQLENGQRTPSLDTLQKMADVMELTLRDLIPPADSEEELDREYEQIVDTLAHANLSIAPAGFCGGNGPDDDMYYVWNKDWEYPEEDRVELSFKEIREAVKKALHSAEIKKNEYLRKRLDAELFSF